ncbi:ABC transporter permease [Agrobacterium rhizogenes]|uniref:ABC transporter permease n=1 Tax=Rhizobium rhizogenes TaxID=359 RepID=UPI0015735E1A|nr:ABC transporter permease [Rhizobium rhizogenes]NTH16732.1 ABC transporter permease [Rhizobium rhizogenes]
MALVILQRIGLGLLTLLLASLLIFAGVDFLPGDLASHLLANNATPANLAALRLELGLDRSWYVRYWEWLSHMLSGDFGHALSNRRSIIEDLKPRALNTFFLAAYAAVLAVPLAIVVGVVAAIRQNGIFDRFVNVIALLSISVPEFFTGYLLVMLFAVKFHIFPVLSNVTPNTGLLERLYLTFLPMTTMVMVVVAHMMRMTRASVLAVMASPYIEMAVLKGLPKWRIVVEHALPNALAPILNVVALNLAYLVVGVVVVEVVFVYPGMGQWIIDSVSKKDLPVVQACGIIFAAVFISINILADVLAIISNPRLRHPR